jgi:hypothetical protein
VIERKNLRNIRRSIHSFDPLEQALGSFAAISPGAGNSLDKARAMFEAPGRYTIRQRSRVLEKWPPG